MTQRLNEQQSFLQVILSDQPEPPLIWRNFDEPIDPTFIFFELEHIILTDGELSLFSFYGKDLFMRLATCASYRDQKLYSTPNEPVVTFHIQMVSDHYSRFSDDANPNLWIANQNRLFWQNKETVIYELPYGVCRHLDLFFRPDHFLEMANRYPVLREMAMEVKTSTSGSLDFFVALHDQDINVLVDQLFDELGKYMVSKERFQHLVECLLLRCMGVFVPVEPVPDDAITGADYFLKDEPTYASPSDDKPLYYHREELGKLVESTKSLTAVELINKFYEERNAYFERKKTVVAFNMLMEEIKGCYTRIMGDMIDLIADSYFAIATCLDRQSANYPLAEVDLEIVTEAIVFACNQSAELRVLPPDGVDLHDKWSKKPFYQDMNLDELSVLVAQVVSEVDVNSPKLDGSKESTAIFAEYMKASFGLKHVSYFMDEQEKDRPQEVVELYQMLIQNLSDEFTITEDGEIRKSDLIRILDFAYEMNDMVPMLLIEIEYFSKDINYVEKQSSEKICWWLLAMQERNNDLHERDLMLRKDRLFGLVDVYESAGDGMHTVESYIRQSKAVFVDLLSKLIKLRFRIEEQTSRGTFMLCVKSFIRAGENTYKLQKEPLKKY